ncbi:RNA 2'-phosphotransferase [Micromonospora musae]|nr:RNA 2'-phosphotransferase [Micromonospora musae]
MDSRAQVPSPGDIARRIRQRTANSPGSSATTFHHLQDVVRRPAIMNPVETATSLADEAKDLEWIIDQLGLKSLSEALIDCFRRDEASPLAALLSADASASEVVGLWEQHLNSGRMSVLEMLAFERWFSLHPSAIAMDLPGGMQFEKTLHVCRQHVGLALYEHARDVNWRRPFVFTRTLALAREYLQRVVAEAHLTNERTRNQFLGKTAVATVLISRFEDCQEETLREAIELLKISISSGNPPQDATPYLLEGVIRLYDLTGDVNLLLDVKDTSQVDPAYQPRVAHFLNMAEIWLRLAERARSHGVIQVCLERADLNLEQAGESHPTESTDRVRQAILSTFLEALRDSGWQRHPSVTIRYLRTPFGLAEHARDHLLLEGNDAGLHMVDRLIAELTTLMDSIRGEPICRRVLADLLSAVSVSSAVPSDRRISALREAIRIRYGNNSPLTDEASRIRQGDDLIRLGALTGDQKVRRDGVLQLLREVSADTSSCNPLVILGRDIETNGPILESELKDIERHLEGQPGYRLSLRAIASGDSTSLYRSAAARAIRSPDVRHRHLGGRSNALTVEDHLGLSTDTFVFKRTRFRSCQLELRRAELIEETLRRDALGDRYGLVDHIAVLEEELPALENDLRSVMTVRRFARGSSLANIGSEEPSLAIARLTSTARYLAHIHAIERKVDDTPSGMRKELKTKEVGRWLKVIVDKPGDRSQFDRWWDLVRALPSFPRRDAHAFNWIVTDEEQILAVDLEAVGWRPVGYELAQLTDDVPILPCTRTGWTQRLAILAAYGETLTQRQMNVGDADLLQGYIAGLTARAIRALSDPSGSHGLRLHGHNLLRLIEMTADLEPARDLARDINLLWARRLGAPAGLTIPDLADARRKHISRALAFHLRHNPTIPRDRAGWAPVETLTSQLRSDGLRVSTIDVLAVAGAIDETRFESSETHVRAMYGHSVHVDISYTSSAERPQLFHATSMRALNQIFQGQGGLRPMSRQWVHLSTEWRKALQAGGRKGSPILLGLASAEQSAATFHHAGGSTWLAEEISAPLLTIIPIFGVFEWRLTNR